MAAKEKHSERWKQIHTSIMTEPGVHFILQNKTKHAPGKFAHHWLPEDTQHIEHVYSTYFSLSTSWRKTHQLYDR